MKKEILLAGLVFFVLACRNQPDAGRNNAGDKKLYQLRFNPPVGSNYHFEVSNEEKLNLEVGYKEVDNIKRAAVGINYAINKDGTGNFIVGMTYDKIRLYKKTSDGVSEIDAAKPAHSVDSIEKMPGTIKMKLDELLWIFPDSAVQVGDKWKSFSTEKNDINFKVRKLFTLKSIDGGVANIESEGQIETDSLSTRLMGYAISGNLKGSQEGVYAMDIKTGVLISAEVKTNMEGTMQLMGMEVQVRLKTNITLDGKKIK
jgi:hypothetical protein